MNHSLMSTDSLELKRNNMNANLPSAKILLISHHSHISFIQSRSPAMWSKCKKASEVIRKQQENWAEEVLSDKDLIFLKIIMISELVSMKWHHQMEFDCDERLSKRIISGSSLPPATTTNNSFQKLIAILKFHTSRQ